VTVPSTTVPPVVVGHVGCVPEDVPAVVHLKIFPAWVVIDANVVGMT
jgi:hypothetical protein